MDMSGAKMNPAKFPLIIHEIMEKLGFKAIPEYEDYFVNRSGQILTIKITMVATKRKRAGKRDYPRFGVNRGRRLTTVSVHSAVARAFLGPVPEGMEVAHLDGNCENPKLENLKYVTRKENHSHKVLHGTAQRGEKHPSAKLKAWQVKEIRALYWSDRKNKSNAAELAKRFNVCKGTILNVANGKRWTHL